MESLLFYFLLYSCFGWLLENTYSWVLGEGFRKRNFLQGPYKPMYGVAPVLLLVLTGPYSHLWWKVLLCLVIPSLVEYGSGALLKGFFHVTYWDYSGFRYQLHGLICLPFSLCWLVLCLVMLYGIHPLVVKLHALMLPVWQPIWLGAGALLIADALWSSAQLWRRQHVGSLVD